MLRAIKEFFMKPEFYSTYELKMKVEKRVERTSRLDKAMMTLFMGVLCVSYDVGLLFLLILPLSVIYLHQFIEARRNAILKEYLSRTDNNIAETGEHPHVGFDKVFALGCWIFVLSFTFVYYGLYTFGESHHHRSYQPCQPD